MGPQGRVRADRPRGRVRGMNKWSFILVAAGLALGACNSKGEPTMPKKVVHYTEDNIRNSAATADETARRAGKRTTHAVDSVTGETRNEGNDVPESNDEPSK